MKKKLMKERTISYMNIIVIMLLTTIITIGLFKIPSLITADVEAENTTKVDDTNNILADEELKYIEEEFIPNLTKDTGLDFNRANVWIGEDSTVVIDMYVELESLGELLVDFNENVSEDGLATYVASMNRHFIRNVEELDDYFGEHIVLQFISSDDDEKALFKVVDGDISNYVFDVRTWINGL